MTSVLANTTPVEGIRVLTETPVAYDSPDHLQPWGTARDNSSNPLFNQKLYALFASTPRPLRILDLGCAGGAFVRECRDDGCVAVGIEGSDWSLRTGRAEWPLGGGRFLFTADITKPFRIVSGQSDDSSHLNFDVITAWEVMEHIAPSDLDGLIENIRNHLLPGGVAIMSISSVPHVVNGVTLHQTVQPKGWWVDFFRKQQLFDCPAITDYFHGQFVRGPKQNTLGSFHVVLSAETPPMHELPKVKLRRWVYDAWIGSPLQRALRRLIAP